MDNCIGVICVEVPETRINCVDVSGLCYATATGCIDASGIDSACKTLSTITRIDDPDSFCMAGFPDVLILEASCPPGTYPEWRQETGPEVDRFENGNQMAAVITEHHPAGYYFSYKCMKVFA